MNPKLCRHPLSVLLLALTLTLLALTSPAQQFISQGNFSGTPPLAFSGGFVTNISCTFTPNTTFTNGQSNVAWFCTSAKGPGIPRVQNISISTDLSPSLAPGGILFYWTTNQSSITNASISGSNQIWMDCTGFASNDIIVIQSAANDTYQRCFVTNAFNTVPAANTNNALQIWPSLGFPVAVGDKVYKMTQAGTIATNAGVTLSSATGLVYGQAGKPLLIEQSFSNAITRGYISGDFFPLTYPLTR